MLLEHVHGYLFLFFEIINLIFMQSKIQHFINVNLNNHVDVNSNISLGDIVFYTFGGVEKFVPSPGNKFNMPIIWLASFVLFLFATLIYPVISFEGVGNEILLIGKKRFFWWISKCIFCIISSTIYLGLMFLTMIGFCFIKNIPLNLSINDTLIKFILEISPIIELKANANIPIRILFLILLAFITLSLIQLILCLWIKPIFSFLIVNTILIASAFFQSYFTIGNFSMLVRHAWINEEGINSDIGFYVFTIICVVIIIVGALRFKRYDILTREEN